MLSSGTRFGPYEIASSIGAGGMGEGPPADSTFGTMFDVTPAGQRFVVIMEDERSRSPHTVRLGRRE